jgi:hypothetical protein
MSRAEQRAPRADADQHQDRHDEEVGRDCEDPPRLPNAAQVAEHQHEHEPERQLHAVDVHLRKRGGDGGDAGRDADRDRQDVVDEQRRGRDERRHLAEVVLRDEIGAASGRVRMNRLAVREDDHREDRGDDEGDGTREAERAGPDKHEHAQDFFRRIRHRGERIGGEDRETGEARESFVLREVRRDRLPDDEALELGEQPFFGHDMPSNSRRG